MIDPMFAAHFQQMRTHADRQRKTPVEPAPISRRQLIALASSAIAVAIAGLSAYRPAAPEPRAPSI